MTCAAKKGSALLMVLWTILVLSVLVFSFAFDAKLQSSANVYVRERVYMDHLVEAGKTLAEMVIAGYESAPEYAEDEDPFELLDKDRWVFAKRPLKQTGTSTTIGPIQIDSGDPEERDPDVQTGTVTVQIESVGGGEGGGRKFNINNLYPGGNPHYLDVWQAILSWAGVPEDDHDYFVNAWVDWRDDDDAKQGDYGDGTKDSGEKEYYEEYCRRTRDRDAGDDVQVEIYKPRNGPIPDLRELDKLAPFHEHPGLLTGGVYNPEEKDKDRQIVVSNILEVLTVFGGDKINVNVASKDVLMCVPGIRPTDAEGPEEGGEEAAEIADLILNWRSGLDDQGRPLDFDSDEESTWIKDWGKLQEIAQDIEPAAQEYLAFTGGVGDGARFNITITARSMGMTHVVKAKMTLRESKPVYLEWHEDP